MRTMFELILSIKRKCQVNEDRIQDELKLSQAEFNGLIVLDGEDNVPGAEFAERMGLSASRGSRVLNKLMNNGYVNAEFKPHDRRSISITLTKKGREMKTKLYNRMQVCEDRICSNFDECNIEKIKEALELLDQVL